MAAELHGWDSPDVRWMIDEGGADTFLEVGFGKVLTSLGKRIEKGVTWTAMPAASEVEEFLGKLGGRPSIRTAC